ncbi:MAG: DUF2156 domain-containing protein [Clostridia bacterium]|nr:DUF2156 domain-containing protein [Clostridia bacterium]MBQ8893227.1 DUF2156 domain-containing protein [Clostridia bacterium]
MTLNFETPSFAMKEVVDQAVRNADVQVCDQTFGNLYCWAAAFEVALAIYEDSFVARWGSRYAVPVGPQRQKLLEELLARGVDGFVGADGCYKAWLEETFPGRFTFTERRSSADYIYDRQKLELLTGKKLAAKRNHINYFEQNFQWQIRPLDDSTLEDAIAFNERWCEQNHCLQEPSLAREGCAVRRGLRHFKELGYTGMVLYANGTPCAFTYGEPIGKAGFCVHVEKADAALRGAYPMINREFVRSLPPEIQWINREDDTGDEGLRKAKLSYQPKELLMKYTAEVVK